MDEEPIFQFFAFEHLPEHLQAVSAPFGRLARQVVENLPRNPERTVALRKLLEAKDAAVRAVLYKPVELVGARAVSDAELRRIIERQRVLSPVSDEADKIAEQEERAELRMFPPAHDDGALPRG